MVDHVEIRHRGWQAFDMDVTAIDGLEQACRFAMAAKPSSNQQQ
jgi:hypothetical protein